jgi:hypothetical protein
MEHFNSPMTRLANRALHCWHIMGCESQVGVATSLSSIVQENYLFQLASCIQRSMIFVNFEMLLNIRLMLIEAPAAIGCPIRLP